MEKVGMSEKDTPANNKLCRRCVRPCKQPATMVMLACPRFQPRPFKSEELRFQQLELFDFK
jgi:hypothetical protein